jgi:hypothetical protein
MRLKPKIIGLFIFLSGILILITAAAKVLSGFGSARVLQYDDPIFSISFQSLFLIAGAIELIIAVVCFIGNSFYLRISLIAWFSTCLLLYRFGVIWIGYHKPCPCLGNLTDALHISPQIADMAMKIILAYLLIGSYASLFWLWRQRKKAVPSAVGAASL